MMGDLSVGGSTTLGNFSTDALTVTGNSVLGTVTGNLQVTGAGPHYISQGNVGIGTTSPEAKLHVASGSAGNVTAVSTTLLALETNNTAGYLEFLSLNNATSQGLRWGDPGTEGGALFIYRPASGRFEFTVNAALQAYMSDGTLAFQKAYTISTASTNDLTIDAGGDFVINDNVGIGTTGPEAALHIVNTPAGTSAPVRIWRTAGGGNRYIEWGSSASDIRGAIRNDGSDGDTIYNVDANGINLVTGTNRVFAANGNANGNIILTPYGSGDSVIVAQEASNGLRLYNSYTSYYDPGNTNFERVQMYWTGNTFNIASQAQGTGVARNFAFTGGSVGIGTTVPGAKLDVSGAANPDIRLTSSSDAGYNTVIEAKYSAANPFNIRSQGVNILSAESSAWNTYLNGYDISGLRSDGTTILDVGPRTDKKVRAYSSLVFQQASSISTTTGALTLQPFSGSNLNINLATTGDFAVNTNQLYVDTSAGNVGIGTTGPSEMLHIRNATRPGILFDDSDNTAKSRILNLGGANQLSLLWNAKYDGSQYLRDETTWGAWVLTGDMGSNQLEFHFVNPAANPISWISALTLGNTSVRVSGNVNFIVDTNVLFVDTSSNNVGIGTTGPGAKLDVLGSIGVSSSEGLGATLSIDNASAVSPLNLRGIYITPAAGSRGVHFKASTGTSDFSFQNDSGNVLLGIIESSGNVGIGTTGPGEKLDVAGSIKLTGRIRQGSMGDVAEMMEVSQLVLRGSSEEVAAPFRVREGYLAMPQPNDVVMIDKTGGIRLSDAPNSTAVIGVISVNPAQILREELPNSVPVALSGTVPCKVTTENGPIYPGDLLTTSSKPGYAMKANPPMVGTIVGKAMEKLEEGEGTVMVFVTRQ